MLPRKLILFQYHQISTSCLISNRIKSIIKFILDELNSKKEPLASWFVCVLFFLLKLTILATKVREVRTKSSYFLLQFFLPSWMPGWRRNLDSVGQFVNAEFTWQLYYLDNNPILDKIVNECSGMVDCLEYTPLSADWLVVLHGYTLF